MTIPARDMITLARDMTAPARHIIAPGLRLMTSIARDMTHHWYCYPLAQKSVSKAFSTSSR